MKPIEESYWINRVALLCREARIFSRKRLASELATLACECDREEAFRALIDFGDDDEDSNTTRTKP